MLKGTLMTNVNPNIVDERRVIKCGLLTPIVRTHSIFYLAECTRMLLCIIIDLFQQLRSFHFSYLPRVWPFIILNSIV